MMAMGNHESRYLILKDVLYNDIRDSMIIEVYLIQLSNTLLLRDRSKYSPVNRYAHYGVNVFSLVVLIK